MSCTCGVLWAASGVSLHRLGRLESPCDVPRGCWLELSVTSSVRDPKQTPPWREAPNKRLKLTAPGLVEELHLCPSELCASLNLNCARQCRRRSLSAIR